MSDFTESIEPLLASLAKRTNIGVDSGYFRRVLEGFNPDLTGRFSEILPDNAQEPVYDDSTNARIYLSLRRVLKLDNPKENTLRGIDKLIESAGAMIGRFSSSRLTRELRSRPGFMNLLSHSDYPYGLVAKIKTYKGVQINMKNGEFDEITLSSSRPLIIVVGYEDALFLRDIEQNHNHYDRSVFLGLGRKNITKEEFENPQLLEPDCVNYSYQ